MSKEVEAHISQHFLIKQLQGSGAYGHVWKVVDKQTGKQYALKKIFDAFQNDVDAQRTYREISVLNELQHFNIIKLHRVIRAKNNKDLYLVFDYMETDLQSLVGHDVLEDVHTRFVIYQMIRALKYLHSAQLIHRDLKPSNILINGQCQIKLCDFGMVRSLMHEEDEVMILTEEVATRWYRSPELLLGSNKYGKQTDIWSLGCIISELLIGSALFPGDSTVDQLGRILQFTGIPSKEDIDSVDSDTAENLINQLDIQKKSHSLYFKRANKDLISLVVKMLEFNPRKRISLEQALELNIFDEFRVHKSHEDVCQKFISHCLDDNHRLTMQQYRKMIYSDIDRRYPPNKITLQNIYSRKSLVKQNREVKKGERNDKSLNRQKSFENQKSVKNCSIHSKQLAKQEKSKAKKMPFCKNLPINITQSSTVDLENVEKTPKQSGLCRKSKISDSKSSWSTLTKVRSRKVIMNQNCVQKQSEGQLIKKKKMQ